MIFHVSAVCVFVISNAPVIRENNSKYTMAYISTVAGTIITWHFFFLIDPLHFFQAHGHDAGPQQSHGILKKLQRDHQFIIPKNDICLCYCIYGWMKQFTYSGRFQGVDSRCVIMPLKASQIEKPITNKLLCWIKKKTLGVTTSFLQNHIFGAFLKTNILPENNDFSSDKFCRISLNWHIQVFYSWLKINKIFLEVVDLSRLFCL